MAEPLRARDRLHNHLASADKHRHLLYGLPVLIALMPLLASCSTRAPESGKGTSPQAESVSTSSLALSASSTQVVREPTPPSLPPDPGYRDRLGPYAQWVLGADALVPAGSPEHLDYLATCVRSAGFQVEVVNQGLSASPGPSQVDSYREVLATCEQAAIDSGLVVAPRPPSADELAAHYDAFLITHQCLIEHEYATTPAPSKEVFVDSGGQAWHPYDALGGLEIGRAEEECPQDLVALFETLAAQG